MNKINRVDGLFAFIVVNICFFTDRDRGSDILFRTNVSFYYDAEFFPVKNEEKGFETKPVDSGRSPFYAAGLRSDGTGWSIWKNT